MSENDSSHIDMLADSVGSDMCQYLWVVRVILLCQVIIESPESRFLV